MGCRPSIVVTCWSATSDMAVMQARAAESPTCTVQAPHSAFPHPNFVPVSPASSRRYQSKGSDGSPSHVCSCPLIVNLITASAPFPTGQKCQFVTEPCGRTPADAPSAFILGSQRNEMSSAVLAMTNRMCRSCTEIPARHTVTASEKPVAGCTQVSAAQVNDSFPPVSYILTAQANVRVIKREGFDARYNIKCWIALPAIAACR